MNKPLHRIFVGTALSVLSLGAFAAPQTYAEAGLSGPAPSSTFQAAASGQLVAYFTGAVGGLTVLAGVSINGVDGTPGLNNHTTPYGGSFVMGNVKAGDKLEFFIQVVDGNRYYSEPTRNTLDGGFNHAWAAAYAGDAQVPAGINVAFEDLLGGGDMNYHDHSFVFQIAAVPEPASWALMLGGVAGLAALRRRR